MAVEKTLVPVWRLATSDVDVPHLTDVEEMSPERLSELRSVLSAFADAPVATMQMHPIERRRDASAGIALHATSPLATQLNQLLSRTAQSAPKELRIEESGEMLYRMVVPAKFASEVSSGLVKPLSAKTVPGGIYGGLRDATGIVGNAAFVPVAGTGVAKAGTAGAGAGIAGAGAAGAGTAAAGVAGAGAITIAAPLVLMAVAVGASAHADMQRQKSLERITELLEAAKSEQLAQERHSLDACRDAIDKATSVLLDQGKVGHSLGLDSASHEISKAISRAGSRVKDWEAKLEKLPEGPVELSAVTKAIPGVLDSGGEFHAHLETARLAVALKRRVLVLQAVEHAQLDNADNPFTSFVGELREGERRLNDLENRIVAVFVRLSELELKRPNGILGNLLFSPPEVDRLLDAAYTLRGYSAHIRHGRDDVDVQIDIERRNDGSLVVFPATPIGA